MSTQGKTTPPSSYAAAGVDVEAGNRLVSRIGALVKATHGPEVIAGIGGFASLFALPESSAPGAVLDDQGPLLVSACDGVGTKLKLAFLSGRHDTVGIDLVAMNVNDLLCTGAKPLFFLDYFACGKLQGEVAEAVIAGIAEGCRRARCALVGGETAEMPGFYADGEYDLAGFSVGMVDRDRVIDGRRAEVGDVVLGIPSTGLHSNGYSLARKVLLGDDEAVDLEAEVPALGRSLADELLEPTAIYVDAVNTLRAAVEPKAFVHVTGGGLIDNPPRVIRDELAWEFDAAMWEVPAVMQLIAEKAQVSLFEMRRTFNMGLGLLVVVGKDDVSAAQGALPLARVVGRLVPRDGEAVRFLGEGE